RTILTTPDGKPLLAQWQSGLGRSVAWTSDMQGKWARDWVAWDQFPRIVGSMVDMLLPPPDSGALTLRSTTEGAQTQLEIDARSPAGQPLNELNLRANLLDPNGAGTPLTFMQVGPGRYRAVAETGNPGVYIAQVAAVDARGQAVGTTTGGVVVSYSLEYSTQRENPQLLNDIAAISGGTINPLPDTVFAPTPQTVGAVRDLGLPLLWLAMLLWPFDIALRRLRLNPGDLVPWLARRRALQQHGPAVTTAAMSRLSAAKERATTRVARPETPDLAGPVRDAEHPPAEQRQPVAPASPNEAPAQPAPSSASEDRFARLMAAKQRARRQRDEA
ncbi:MAG TPA: VWA domain-containing protein, partial [Roseiflexaceae bacterium]|nr:VWA domain-containing protein [Roseiflexaceae bacterium]